MMTTPVRAHHSSGSTLPRVVVGIDSSPSSMEVLAWATAEAERLGAALEIVHVDFARQEALEALAPDMLGAERSVLDRAITRARALAPDVFVTGRICDPPAARALIAASKGAEMLVIGSRGLGRLGELTMGSVSSECARHALCPVTIVRPTPPRPATEVHEWVTTSGSPPPGRPSS